MESRITEIAGVISKVRNQTPLIQAITNYVTINDCANILLAYGASPAMVEALEEAYDFAKISSSIYINVGTLTKEQELAAVEASKSAKDNNVPLILDPVGCAAIPRKLQVIDKMLKLGRIDVIKGNAGEIKYLAGEQSKVRGVDSTDDGDGVLEASISLAKKYACIVAATGKVDIVTNGHETAYIYNGVEMLTKITGTGCMLGALCAAASSVIEDKLIAVIAAVVAMGVAGELAFKESKLPGTFKCKLLDSIYLLNEEIIEREGKVTWK